MGEHAHDGLALRPLVNGDILSPVMNVVTRAVRDALAGAPVSLREIGRRAGVSHAQLARIVAGERNATPAVARAVADALDEIGVECVTGAAQVRRSLTIHKGRK